ncbi:hypothetical protein AOQ84DRAFT_391505 [Glonium stellatum]|uniref:BTB domain-containing protein n=1 Tax=Glonium stellatum TaxID=574774 RepID=A0A8E2JPA2_9PEZI|nr:hypothetical protein AOQ84DRAFT_391505 [Glonium stellatum]
MDTMTLSGFVPQEAKTDVPVQWLTGLKPHMSIQDTSYYGDSSKSESGYSSTNSSFSQDHTMESYQYGQEIDDDVVVVTVGTALHNCATLCVSKHLICSYSFFFKLVCSSPMPPSIPCQVELPDEDSAIFLIFVKWLYTRNIEIPDPLSSILEYIIPIYTLADRLRATALKNSLIDLLVVIYSEEASMLDISDVVLIYANTSTGSGLRRWAVDEYPRLPENIQHASWDNYGKQCPEFFFDLAKASFNNQTLLLNPASDPTRYHDHDGVTHAGCCNY